MRKNRRTRKTALTGWIMTGVAMLGVGALLAAPILVGPPARLDPTTLCPVDQPPSGQVALLVDRTDPYDAAQQLRVAETISDVKASLPVGGKLTVHVLTADPAEAARPLIELCNPGDGNLVDPLVGNPRQVQRKFDENFAAPIEALAESLMQGESADRSPILEAIGYVASGLDRGTPGKLVVISDLLQNSAAQSHYRSAPDALAVLRTPEGSLFVDGRLAGVEVDLVLLKSPSQLRRQGEDLQAFWSEVLIAAGARPTFGRF